MDAILGCRKIKASNLLSGHHFLMYMTDMLPFVVQTGQVTYRMTYNQSSHVRLRLGVCHFVGGVPSDIRQYYRRDRVTNSLRTKSEAAATRSAKSISQRLDYYWHDLRLQKIGIPGLHLVIGDNVEVDDSSPSMMDAVDVYLRLKADKQTPTFIHATKRNGGYVAGVLGNRPVTSYLTSDAAALCIPNFR